MYEYKTLNTKARYSFETSESSYPVTRFHIPEERSLQAHGPKDLESHTV